MRVLFLCLMALPAAAQQITNFKNVEFYHRSDPNSSPRKRDGVLAIDRDTGILVFNSDNNLLCTIDLDDITMMKVMTRGDRVLTIQYRDRRNLRFAEFELKSGDNRDNILSTIESATGKSIERLAR